MKKQVLAALLIIVTGYVSFSLESKRDSLFSYLQAIQNDDRSKAVVLFSIGETYLNSNPDSALLYFEKGLVLAKSNNQKRLVADISNGIGQILHQKGFYEKAAENYLAAIKIFEEFISSPDTTTAKTGRIGLSGAYGNLGNIFLRQGMFDRAIDFFSKASSIYNECGNKLGVTNCLMSIGNIHLYKGEYHEAINKYSEALSLYKELKNKIGISNCYNNIGIIELRQGRYADAMRNLLRAKEIYEELSHKAGVANCCLNIGIIYKQQNEYENAIDYFFRALSISEEFGDENGKAKALNNIGNTYFELGTKSNSSEKTRLLNKAIEFYKKTEKIRLSKNDINSLSSTYANIGNTYSELKKYYEAIEYYKKSLNITVSQNDKYGTSSIYKSIAENYYIMTDSLTLTDSLKNQFLKLSVENGKKAFKLAIETGSLPLQVDLSRTLLNASIKLRNAEDALSYSKILVETKDSLFIEEKYHELADFQAKYESEKQLQEIEKQQLVIEKQAIENRRQRYMRNFFIAGFVFLAIISILVYSGYRQKRKSNRLISEKNELLENANAEISSQRDLVVTQKEKLEEINRNTTESLRYARSIQASILPSENALKTISKESFVYSKPCELVSGDFFWATSFDEFHVFCVADCTGHGVPGAFMSILGISALNEIVVKKQITKPSVILDILREYVIEALSHNDPEQLHKDGMDMALCTLNSKTNELQFSGAGLPIWIVTNDENVKLDSTQKILTKNGVSMYEIKGNNMPVGTSPSMNPFENLTCNLSKSEVNIYLSTDGYADQFGGPNQKKYMVRKLRNLLLDISSLPMEEQRNELDTDFEKWKKGVPQVDDVTILGIRLS